MEGLYPSSFGGQANVSIDAFPPLSPSILDVQEGARGHAYSRGESPFFPQCPRRQAFAAGLS